jgi:molybdate transport system ATP-binding protein
LPELALDVALERATHRLEVRERLELDGITSLFGPSGSGKTTLHRIISGLERGARGDVVFAGREWQAGARRVPPHARGVGYVFQDGRLFSHLSVAGNLAFGLRSGGRGRRGGPIEMRAGPIKIEDVVAALDLEPLLARRPESLSGGERQRVAIGRALLANPRLLLMDEPMSSLDAARKREILPYIERLPGAFGLPILYVTHSVEEVVRLASEVVVLVAGRVTARGSVAEIIERMDLWPVTGRLEAGAVVEAEVVESAGGMATLRLGAQRLRIPLDRAAPGSRRRLRIHARDVALATTRPVNLSIRNVLEARVLRIDVDASAYVEVLLSLEGAHLRSRITREALAELGLAEGQEVFALIKSVALEDGIGRE